MYIILAYRQHYLYQVTHSSIEKLYIHLVLKVLKTPVINKKSFKFNLVLKKQVLGDPVYSKSFKQQVIF